jgi:hypothetical protein
MTELMRRVTAAADERARQAELREQLMRERVAFQEQVIALYDSNQQRFSNTINNLLAQVRMTTAERDAHRCDLLMAACARMTRRMPMTCAMCHRQRTTSRW